MHQFLIKFINLIFYSNLWIALAGLSMTLQTYWLYKEEIIFNPLSIFVFTSTLFLYALHRIVGLVKVQSFINKGRFKVIATFKHHIIIYAVLAGLGTLYCFLLMDWELQLALILPGLISLAYVLPFLTSKRRLRDLGLIKIFLIAIVWAYVTVLLPILEMEKSLDLTAILMLLERTLFIFAITLPFDIRDLAVDARNKVATIPARIGVAKTKYLAYGCLGIMAGLIFWNYWVGFYEITSLLPLLLSCFSTGFIIHYSTENRHDYFYTGLLDGTMILQFLLTWSGLVIR